MQKYTGKTVEEILENISNEKNVTKEEITYNVVEEKAGFLGVGKEVTIEAYTKKDVKDFIYDYLMNYFDNMNMDVNLEISETEGFYKAKLSSSNNAILIGKNGNTLQSINTVLKAAISGEFKTRIPSLVDINGYKDERYQKVCRIADRVARDVVRSKTDALLDPMPNDERKQIHNHLTNREHIATKSEGEGRDRRIKICYVE